MTRSLLLIRLRIAFMLDTLCSDGSTIFSMAIGGRFEDAGIAKFLVHMRLLKKYFRLAYANRDVRFFPLEAAFR